MASAENYVRSNPAPAAAMAFGAGFLLSVLPARTLVRPLTYVVAQLIPPVLMGLGLIKAFELCSQSGKPVSAGASAHGAAESI